MELILIVIFMGGLGVLMPLGMSGAVYSACPLTETTAVWTVLLPFSSPGNRAPDSGSGPPKRVMPGGSWEACLPSP